MTQSLLDKNKFKICLNLTTCNLLSGLSISFSSKCQRARLNFTNSLFLKFKQKTNSYCNKYMQSKKYK